MRATQQTATIWLSPVTRLGQVRQVAAFGVRRGQARRAAVRAGPGAGRESVPELDPGGRVVVCPGEPARARWRRGGQRSQHRVSQPRWKPAPGLSGGGAQVRDAQAAEFLVLLPDRGIGQLVEQRVERPGHRGVVMLARGQPASWLARPVSWSRAACTRYRLTAVSRGAAPG